MKNISLSYLGKLQLAMDCRTRIQYLVLLSHSSSNLSDKQYCQCVQHNQLFLKILTNSFKGSERNFLVCFYMKCEKVLPQYFRSGWNVADSRTLTSLIVLRSGEMEEMCLSVTSSWMKLVSVDLPYRKYFSIQEWIALPLENVACLCSLNPSWPSLRTIFCSQISKTRRFSSLIVSRRILLTLG